MIKDLISETFLLDDKISLILSPVFLHEYIDSNILGNKLADLLEPPFILNEKEASTPKDKDQHPDWKQQRKELVDLFNLVNNERIVIYGIILIHFLGASKNRDIIIRTFIRHRPGISCESNGMEDYPEGEKY